MKAYVNYVNIDGAKARVQLNRDDIRDDEMVVQFSETSDHWKMNLVEGQSNCDLLNRAAQLHNTDWPTHRCHFEVEAVGLGDYAIVCNDHPPKPS